MNIKINKYNTLTKKDYKSILKSKYTINLSNVKSSDLHLTNIERRLNKRKKEKLYFIVSVVLLILAIGFTIRVYANIETTPKNLTSKVYQEKNIPLTTDEYLKAQTKAYSKEYRKRLNYEARLFKFIEQGEGAFQSNAFCDSYYKTKYRLIRKSPKDCTRWSIGFGTKSYWGEKITLEEAHKRKEQDILQRDKLITSNCLTDNQRIVAVDYMYQHGVNSGLVKHYANTCQPNRIYNHIVWLRDKYKQARKWGLVKREQKRINLFYN